MYADVFALPSAESGQSVPTLESRVRIRAGEKISASGGNEDSDAQGMREPIPKGTPGDNALDLDEIKLALSMISSNLGKLVPVKRQHVAPPVITALLHLFFLMLIRQPIENVISAVFSTFLLMSFAWPVWTTLKPMHHRLDRIDVKMGALQEPVHRRFDEINLKIDVLKSSIESIKLAVLRRPTVDSVPTIVQPSFPNAVEELEAPPGREMPIKPREALQPVKNDENFVTYITSVAPEPERKNELPEIVIPTSAALVPKANTNKPYPNQASVEPKVHPATADKPDPIPAPVELSRQAKHNFDNPTISVSPPDPVTYGRVELLVTASAEQHGRQLEPSFRHWSSTLLEIQQKIEPLASDILQRLPRSEQREPVDLVSLRRILLRLLMYCASIPTADLASPYGFLGPPASMAYYPTGDPVGDRDIAFTTALDCLDELLVLLTGNAKAEIAAALSELTQALSDLGLHKFASTVSSLALEVLRVLYAADPNQFRSRVASIQSLRANILADLRQNDDAADAAEEAVTIIKEQGYNQPELIYVMLNYAVLLGSIGRGEGAAAVTFELMGYIDNSTILQPDIILVSPLCQLCFSNAVMEFDSDLALHEAEKAIEASRASLDANSEVMLAGALLTKSKILSSTGQNDAACPISIEAVTLFRSASADRRVFSLLLAHALFTNSNHLSEANRKGEAYSTILETVELWQGLQFSAPIASKRPLAWALFELGKYRTKGADKQKRRSELQIAESAVSTFREVSPPDYAGLADALYLYADRMLELDKNREAASYAEESVQYFREAREESPHKYALDLVFSLSLASSCLACTERSMDALEYAKQAVEVQHERDSNVDPQYKNHLRMLLMDVLFRFTEIDKQQDALSWMHELQQLGVGDTVKLGALQYDEPKKETICWTGTEAAAAQPRPNTQAMDFARGSSGNNNDLLSNLLGIGGMEAGSIGLTDRPLGQRTAQASPLPRSHVGRLGEMSGVSLERILSGLEDFGPGGGLDEPGGLSEGGLGLAWR